MPHHAHRWLALACVLAWAASVASGLAVAVLAAALGAPKAAAAAMGAAVMLTTAGAIQRAREGA